MIAQAGEATSTKPVSRRPGAAWIGVAVLCGAALCAFVLQQLARPVAPDTDQWSLAPVASHAMPQVREEAPSLSPGLLLDGYDQIAAQLADQGDLADGRIRLGADLGFGSALHVFFRTVELDNRHRQTGYALFLDPADVPGTGIYLVHGDHVRRLECTFEGAVPRRLELELRLAGPEIEVWLDGERRCACSDDTFEVGGVGFRSGMSPITLASIVVENDAGTPLFAAHPERFQASVALKGLLCLLVLLLFGAFLFAEGWLTARLIGEDTATGVRITAWTYIPVLLLPILGWMELGAIADGLRLGRTPLTVIQLLVAIVPVVLLRSTVMLARVSALRVDRESVPSSAWSALTSTRAGWVTLGVIGVHALLLGNLAWSHGGGVAACLELEPPAWVDVGLTIAVLVAGPLLLLLLAARLVRGEPAPLLRVEALSWLPSLLAATVPILRLATGSAEPWPLPFHLVAAVLFSATVKFLFVQANARAFRLYNWVSLVGCLLLALLAEGAVRQTYLDLAWDPVPADRFQRHPLLGWVRASNEFDAILHEQDHTDYPAERLPVAFPEGGGESRRVVCLGGSSTGGAYQMDDLEQFYPAVLQRVLDELARDEGMQVINQGVGGWNSFHCLLYLREFIDALDPDLVTLYLGNNDIKTRGPWTYREYWSNYHSRSRQISAIQGLLNRARLYVGLKSVVLMLSSSPRQVSAVPTEDARENYVEIIDMAQARGARVLLISEAIFPLPEDIDVYYTMMEELARERGELYLDAASAFAVRRHEDLFLDSNHLSAYGHQVMAELMAGFLDEEGLVHLDGPLSGAEALIPVAAPDRPPEIAPHLGAGPGGPHGQPHQGPPPTGHEPGHPGAGQPPPPGASHLHQPPGGPRPGHSQGGRSPGGEGGAAEHGDAPGTVPGP